MGETFHWIEELLLEKEEILSPLKEAVRLKPLPHHKIACLESPLKVWDCGKQCVHSKSVQTSILRNLFVRSWWAVVFSTLCIAFYFQAAHSRSTAFFDLSTRMRDMEQEKLIVSQEQDELNLRLQSESDPAWIEMTLMKELGVVPDGWTKVHFQK